MNRNCLECKFCSIQQHVDEEDVIAHCLLNKNFSLPIRHWESVYCRSAYSHATVCSDYRLRIIKVWKK